MGIGAEVCDCPDVGILVGDLGLAGIAGRLVSSIVDMTGFVPFTVGVDHGSLVPLTRETFFLKVPLLVAVPVDDVGVPGTTIVGLIVVADRAIVLLRRKAIVAGSKVAICSISCSVSSSKMMLLASSG